MFNAVQVINQVVFFLVIISVQSSQASVPETLLDSESSRPIVHTPVGCFRGLRAQDGDYSMFLGIPYARVDPENVFGTPIPVRFEGIFEANDDTAICPQKEEFNKTITGKLDCLHINIYVPNSASVDHPVPVMTHIFGGKFEFGFPSRYVYGPRFLVRHDVIFITFNYRLGPYGFFCLNTSKVPGNQGLKDQVHALRWIKENIRYFGGDDSKITLEGNSAGAMSVDLHQHFLQEPLYNRVIIQSGVLLTNGVIQHPDPDAPLKLAKQLNYTTNDINEALSFLNKVEPHELIAATTDSDMFVGPCVEKQFDNAENYIMKYPANVNSVRIVDVLIGFTNDEGYGGITVMEKEEFEKKDFVSELLEAYYDFKNESKILNDMKKIVRSFYYGSNLHRADNMRPGINIFADFVMYHPIIRTIRKYLDSGVENMYLYMFSYAGERDFAKDKDNLSNTEGTATHADELGYLFDISYMKERVRDEDMLIVDMMTELWTNFAKHGNPTPKPSKLIPLQWPRVSQDKLPYLEINTELRLGSRPMHERMSFLDLLYKHIGRYHKEHLWIEH
ncbi:juvenile hormone esterase-like isoform X1 [Cydia pomonella]|uniref:juvenile hormone esterase-like isoform X1 n=1 Tax=Cydia pomonella TaxID=82600 RepID=UPI002ADDA45E|nr:juvenile hormone esterase-like isoform X1 [Cydia pomonella]XP_061706647.1 juvenile hormone esterase-like isoform X1 [Cydia pomonella]